MFNKYLLPLVSVIGFAFAVFYTVVQATQTTPVVPPLTPPPTRPSNRTTVIAGAGIVEAQQENIPIGTNVPGVVWEVFIKKGDYVKKGDPLFRIDSRDLQAQLEIREAELDSARAQLEKLRAAPRPEDIPPLKAAVQEAEARLADSEAAVGRTEKLYNRQMLAASDYDKDRFAYYAARAAVAKAKADLERLLAGTWKEDIKIAEAAVRQAESQVDGIKINLDRLTVRALSDGRVLQLNVRLGQFAAMTWKEPMVVLGNVSNLHVRVDIDENDLPYFEPKAEAIATLKGRPLVRFPLEFKYVEPYVVPKLSLTGSNSERVDTRVLQVVYALPSERPIDLYVGEQMDVYLKAATAPEGVSLDTGDGSDVPFSKHPTPATKAEPVPSRSRQK